jgi:hypothetical protein
MEGLASMLGGMGGGGGAGEMPDMGSVMQMAQQMMAGGGEMEAMMNAMGGAGGLDAMMQGVGGVGAGGPRPPPAHAADAAADTRVGQATLVVVLGKCQQQQYKFQAGNIQYLLLLFE